MATKTFAAERLFFQILNNTCALHRHTLRIHRRTNLEVIGFLLTITLTSADRVGQAG